MTQEEKAKRYDEAIEIARQIHDADRVSGIELTTCEEIFPELKKPDEEMIRKALIHYMKDYSDGTGLIHAAYGVRRNDAIAWLEKQGEIIKEWSEMKFNNIQTELQEMVDLKLKTEQGEQKPIDKIQLGKKYKCIASPRYSTFRIGEIYKPEDKFLCSLMNFCSDCFEPIEDEQKPAYTKEYDFHGIKFIPKFAKGDIIKDKKCGEVSTIEDFSYDTGLYTHTYGQFPITIQDNYEIIEQESAWGKEDEKIIRRIDSLLYSQCKIHGSEYEEIHNWLKSLKDRVQPQPKQEWSEEEIEKAAQEWDSKANFKPFYMTSTGVKQDITSHKESFKAGINWILKSLRPQSTWKPSEEQIEILDMVLSNESMDDNVARILRDIREQLKKLREE